MTSCTRSASILVMLESLQKYILDKPSLGTSKKQLPDKMVMQFDPRFPVVRRGDVIEIYGEESTGKSALATCLAEQINQWYETWFPDCASCPILCVDAEGCFSDSVKKHAKEENNFLVFPFEGQESGLYTNRIREMLQAIQNADVVPSVVIFDSMTALCCDVEDMRRYRDLVRSVQALPVPPVQIFIHQVRDNLKDLGHLKKKAMGGGIISGMSNISIMTEYDTDFKEYNLLVKKNRNGLPLVEISNFIL